MVGLCKGQVSKEPLRSFLHHGGDSLTPVGPFTLSDTAKKFGVIARATHVVPSLAGPMGV